MPLTFTRGTFVPAEKPSPIGGIWLGPGLDSMRVQITVKSDVAGHELCSLDSVDPQDFGRPCANVTFAPPDFSFDVPSVEGHHAGKPADDGRSLASTFTAAEAPDPLSPAIAPVDAAGMQPSPMRRS
jgi:hypothetical protein